MGSSGPRRFKTLSPAEAYNQSQRQIARDGRCTPEPRYSSGRSRDVSEPPLRCPNQAQRRNSVMGEELDDRELLEGFADTLVEVRNLFDNRLVKIEGDIRLLKQKSWKPPGTGDGSGGGRDRRGAL